MKNNRKILAAGIGAAVLTGAIVMSGYGGDFSSLYEDAYNEAMDQYNEAYNQAMSEYNDAYNQAMSEMNEAFGGSSSADEYASQDSADSSQDAEMSVQSVKDYVGRNLASFGYTSLGGDRNDDSYGGTWNVLKLAIVADDGTYIDIEDEEQLKQYVVTDQNIEPGSELIFRYGDTGFVDTQTYDEIELLVKKAGEDTADPILTELGDISPSPDMSTQYVKDYVGRNLASVGYTGLDGNWHDSYNGTWNTVDLVIIADDGSYLDPEDKDTLKNYVVTSQSPEFNTQIDFVYSASGFVDSKTYSEIELHVARLE